MISLYYDKKLQYDRYFVVSVRSEGIGESACVPRLVLAFTARMCDKYQNL